jgi:4-alpha-glucanotransferase
MQKKCFIRGVDRVSYIHSERYCKRQLFMQSSDELLAELSGLCGIIPEYWDIFGNKKITSAETRKAVLNAMNIRIDSDEGIQKEISMRKAGDWKSFVSPVHVLSVNEQPRRIPLYLAMEEGQGAGLVLSWIVENEDKPSGASSVRLRERSVEDIPVEEVRWIDGERHVKIFLLDDEPRDIGYYLLTVKCGHPGTKSFAGEKAYKKKSRIILTPDTCYIPEELERSRAWGVSLNLYSIRSERNWGIGDFADLKRTVAWVAGLKGDCVGINPLHAIPNTKPFGISPYSPISRLYKNYIYLDVETITEVAESQKLQKQIASKLYQTELHEARQSEFIDYEKIAALKEKVLRQAFEIFYSDHYLQNTRRGQDFQQYIREEGGVLESFALFMALREHFQKTKNAYTWHDWPEEYHRLSGKSVRTFRKAHEKEVLYYQYLQWLIDGQLRDIAEGVKNLRMCIGLYHDLAVGSVGGGSDAWNYRDVIAGDADLGAPPDDFNINGQNWGFPPFIPGKMREIGYELFIQTIRKNMKYGGAIRIDHALGLFRLFWVPKGLQPKEGAYVSCPSEDLVRIIALESVRNRTVVIAEDLGTIGDNVRETLKKYKMLSYRLFYFERKYPDPSFLEPEKYPDLALCAVTTHDLPTLYGYWAGRDLQVKKQLGLFQDDSQFQKHLKERERDKKLILSAMKSKGVVPAGYPSDPALIPEMTPELCIAIYTFLSFTPCKLFMVSLDDIIGTLNQQNMPGTVDEHPNWMQKMPVILKDITKDNRFFELSGMLNRTF